MKWDKCTKHAHTYTNDLLAQFLIRTTIAPIITHPHRQVLCARPHDRIVLSSLLPRNCTPMHADFSKTLSNFHASFCFIIIRSKALPQSLSVTLRHQPPTLNPSPHSVPAPLPSKPPLPLLLTRRLFPSCVSASANASELIRHRLPFQNSTSRLLTSPLSSPLSSPPIPMISDQFTTSLLQVRLVQELRPNRARHQRAEAMNRGLNKLCLTYSTCQRTQLPMAHKIVL